MTDFHDTRHRALSDLAGSPASEGIGARTCRSEDERLLRGEGRFFAERHVAGELHVAFVRSPYAHARICRIDNREAQGSRGVRSVLTGEDLHRLGWGAMPESSTPKRLDGRPARGAPWLALARERVRYVGEAVAMVVAETPELAEQAAERVLIDYESLSSVVEPRAAIADGAPDLGAPYGNIAHDWNAGDARQVEEAFARAAYRTKASFIQNRIAGAAMETRGALVVPDGERLTLYTPTQGVGIVRDALAVALGMARHRIRVVTDDVGGGFGLKNNLYPEHVAMAIAARQLEVPLHWLASRSEAFLADYQGRDHDFVGELALDSDFVILAIRCSVLSNMGAYLTDAGPIIPTSGGVRNLTNLYRIPCFFAEAQCVLTNTVPISAYRGAGKPEYCYLIERLIDEAARACGVDRLVLRRRNLIRPVDLPWRAPTGMVYDSGEYEAMMDRVIELADFAGFPKRFAQARERGVVRGIGLSLFSEPDGFLDNQVTLRFASDGRLTLVTSSVSNGQGHETSLAQIVVSRLHVPLDRIDVVQGDSDLVGEGQGTAGSRTMTVSGTAIWQAGGELIALAARQAAHLLETATDQVEFVDGVFRVRGASNRYVDWITLAGAAHDRGRLAPGAPLGLEAMHHYKAETYNFPAGAHICEIEIDPETGLLTIIRYNMIGDFGTIINPLLLEGQMQGGVAQGIGQALVEHCIYDPEDGQLRTGSFIDYAIPRADLLPPLLLDTVSTPTGTNPLGVKGVGESGCTASMPAVMNAIADALAACSCPPIDMPATPETLWRALRAARSP